MSRRPTAEELLAVVSGMRVEARRAYGMANRSVRDARKALCAGQRSQGLYDGRAESYRDMADRLAALIADSMGADKREVQQKIESESKEIYGWEVRL